MESKAIFRYIRRSPRKIRLVVHGLRGQKVQDALDKLNFARQAAARDVVKLIRSAVANATQKGGIRPDHLYIKSIYVDQGPVMKRWMPRARGSGAQILKKMSHITVVVGDKFQGGV